MRNTIFTAIALCILAAAAVCLTAGGQTPDGFDDLLSDINTADSDTITPDSLLNRSLETFKTLKFKKLDGAPLDSVSPMAYDCYQQAVEAIDAQVRDSKEWYQAKEILRDLSRDLIAGAFFYSKNTNQAEMTKFARAYLDISLLDAFKGEEIELDRETLAMIAYISASGAYNEKEYAKAIDYFKI